MFSVSSGIWLLSWERQERGPLPVGCLVLSIPHSTLVSAAQTPGVVYLLFVANLLQATILSPSSLSLVFTSQHLLVCGDKLLWQQDLPHDVGPAVALGLAG